MPVVHHVSRFSSPLAQVFDASLRVSLHRASLASSDETVLAAPEHDRLALGDEVTWQARYGGLRWRMTVRVVALDEDVTFTDEQVRGPFGAFSHVHRFTHVGGRTVVTDRLTFEVPLRPLGLVARPWVTQTLRGVLRDRELGLAQALGETRS